jgi:hypothetical protein
VAGHHLSTDAADAVLAGYLADLGARLRGPRRRRAEILAEIRDGLHEATSDNTGRGMDPAAAAAAALLRFGGPQTVADAFAGELVTAHARRAIEWFLATGPLVGIWWLLLLQPRPWHTGPVALVAAVPVLPLIAVAIAAGAGTYATTGRLIRWLPETTPRRALAGTTAVAGSCVASDLTMIAVCLASGAAGRPLGAVAVAASLARVAASLAAIRRCLRLRRHPSNHRHPSHPRHHGHHGRRDGGSVAGQPGAPGTDPPRRTLGLPPPD